MKKYNYLENAVHAAIHAGKEIIGIYNKEHFKVDIKSDNSPLTEADNASNAIINTYLRKTKIPIISEENKEIEFCERKKWNQCWIVDPLDGTKEFIKRNGEFTVNIALVENGKPKIGVVYVPVARELYYAIVDDKKAYKIVLNENFINPENWLDSTFQIQPRRVDEQNIKVVGSRTHMNDATKTYIENLEKLYSNIEIVPKGSSLKFCIVAEGKADFYPRFAPTMEWDTAAGQAICEAVGLKIVSQRTFQNLTYNKEDLLNDYFLVSN